MKNVIKAAAIHNFEVGKSYDRDEIMAAIEPLLRERGYAISGFLPTDYCYNLWNSGIPPIDPEFSDYRLFEQMGRGRDSRFRFLGPKADYTGKTLHFPKGSRGPILYGTWENGVFTKA
jgi:hypothetical protein